MQLGHCHHNYAWYCQLISNDIWTLTRYDACHANIFYMQKLSAHHIVYVPQRSSTNYPLSAFRVEGYILPYYASMMSVYFKSNSLMFVTKACFFHVFILHFVLTNYLVNLTLVLCSLYYMPIHLVKCACFFILRILPIKCILRDRKKSTHWLELPLKHIGWAFLIILAVTLRFQARVPKRYCDEKLVVNNSNRMSGYYNTTLDI